MAPPLPDSSRFYITGRVSPLTLDLVQFPRFFHLLPRADLPGDCPSMSPASRLLTSTPKLLSYRSAVYDSDNSIKKA